jgi:hypothetical protein
MQNKPMINLRVSLLGIAAVLTGCASGPNIVPATVQDPGNTLPVWYTPQKRQKFKMKKTWPLTGCSSAGECPLSGKAACRTRSNRTVPARSGLSFHA